ncbi:MAG: helix-turn-helix transcriptional regulator [Bacteroidetes bacterium]|nr:helix-turn-helix transcriptional regulator [Bacteroidota bacterium]
MTPEFERLFSRYLSILSLQQFDERDIDYSHLEKHLGFLRQLALVENSSVAVMDLYRQRYAFLQSKFLPVIGLELETVMQQGPRALFSIMHPQDIPVVLETLQRGNGYLIGLPAAEKKEHKIIYDFRLRSAKGTYARFIQQLLPLELDARGNIWLMLMLNDIVPERGEEMPPQRSVVNMRTGKQCVFSDEESGRTVLSKREIEILGMLSKGMGSKQVADELFLSVNTVNNHRRNILEKTNTENTAEAVRYAVSLGLV